MWHSPAGASAVTLTRVGRRRDNKYYVATAQWGRNPHFEQPLMGLDLRLTLDYSKHTRPMSQVHRGAENSG